MKDKYGTPIDIGHEVQTVDGTGRVTGMNPTRNIVIIKTRKSDRNATIIVSYRPGDIEVLGQSLEMKMHEERWCR